MRMAGAGQPHAACDVSVQVREQTRMVDASSIVLGESTEDGGSRPAGGARRRRKQPCPEPSLLPMDM